MISTIYYLLYVGIQCIRISLFLIALVIFIGVLKPFLNEHGYDKVLTPIYHIDKKISDEVDKPIRKTFPTTINNKDMTPWLKIIVLIMLASFLKQAKNRAKYKSLYYRQLQAFNKLKLDKNISENNPAFKELEQKMKAVEQSSRPKDAMALLEDYVSLKKQIEQSLKSLTFLSIDIVGSTQLKDQEDKADIQYDFLLYNKHVREIMTDHKSLKSSWTPDGVMACFEKADDAVQAAKEIVAFVRHFNKELKHINQDFRVRYGINSGKVYYDDSLNLEEITDEVIDIAGHLQKYGEHDTIMISKNTHEKLSKRDEFRKADITVDGVTVYRYESPTDSRA